MLALRVLVILVILAVLCSAVQTDGITAVVIDSLCDLHYTEQAKPHGWYVWAHVLTRSINVALAVTQLVH